MTSKLQNQVLSIDAPRKEAAKLSRRLVPLYGSPPEEGDWYHFADSYDDTRERGAWTIQFRSQKIDDILTNKVSQDAVKGALWTALGNLLGREDLPEVTFDEYEYEGPERAFYPVSRIPCGIINLIFPSEHGFNTAGEYLKEIHLPDEGSKKMVYTLADTSTMSGRIFIFDCVNLHLETIDPESLFLAMSHMTKHLGQLLGLSKIVVEAKNPKIASPTTVRGYLRLSRPWLAVRLVELVYELPTKFVWHGRPHRLLYTGHDLLRRQLNSADYPLKTYGRRGAQAKESSPEEESSGGETASSSRRRKKRREE